jgi:hypothetical protein
MTAEMPGTAIARTSPLATLCEPCIDGQEHLVAYKDITYEVADGIARLTSTSPTV